MTEQERYLFDLQGYLVVRDALTPEQITTLNGLVDTHLEAKVAPDAPSHRFGNLLAWGEPMYGVLDNPRLMPYLDAILGANFRLDHDYCDVIRGRKGPIGWSLHGGGTPFDPSQYYRFQDNRIFCGLTVVAYNLHDIGEGDGGFGCVPGSHKSNLPFPNEWRDLEQAQPFVDRVIGPAGTAVIFTEALTHGTLPWNAAHERRTLFFKYSPGPLSWASNYYDPANYPGLSEKQTALLRKPSVRIPDKIY